MNGYLQHDWWVWVPYIVTLGVGLFGFLWVKILDIGRFSRGSNRTFMTSIWSNESLNYIYRGRVHTTYISCTWYNKTLGLSLKFFKYEAVIRYCMPPKYLKNEKWLVWIYKVVLKVNPSIPQQINFDSNTVRSMAAISEVVLTFKCDSDL